MNTAIDEAARDGASAPTPTPTPTPVAGDARTGMASDAEVKSTAVIHERGDDNNPGGHQKDAEGNAAGGTAREVADETREEA